MVFVFMFMAKVMCSLFLLFFFLYSYGVCIEVFLWCLLFRVFVVFVFMFRANVVFSYVCIDVFICCLILLIPLISACVCFFGFCVCVKGGEGGGGDTMQQKCIECSSINSSSFIIYG